MAAVHTPPSLRYLCHRSPHGQDGVEQTSSPQRRLEEAEQTKVTVCLHCTPLLPGPRLPPPCGGRNSAQCLLTVLDSTTNGQTGQAREEESKPASGFTVELLRLSQLLRAGPWRHSGGGHVSTPQWARTGGGAAATRQRDMVSSPRYDMWSPDHSALAGPRHPPQTRLGCPRSRGSSSQAPSRWGERPRGEQWGASENKPRVLRPALWPHLTGGARWGGSKGPLPGGGEQKTRKGLSHLQSDTRYI